MDVERAIRIQVTPVWPIENRLRHRTPPNRPVLSDIFAAETGEFQNSVLGTINHDERDDPVALAIRTFRA